MGFVTGFLSPEHRRIGRVRELLERAREARSRDPLGPETLRAALEALRAASPGPSDRLHGYRELAEARKELMGAMLLPELEEFLRRAGDPEGEGPLDGSAIVEAERLVEGIRAAGLGDYPGFPEKARKAEDLRRRFEEILARGGTEAARRLTGDPRAAGLRAEVENIHEELRRQTERIRGDLGKDPPDFRGARAALRRMREVGGDRTECREAAELVHQAMERFVPSLLEGDAPDRLEAFLEGVAPGEIDRVRFPRMAAALNRFWEIRVERAGRVLREGDPRRALEILELVPGEDLERIAAAGPIRDTANRWVEARKARDEGRREEAERRLAEVEKLLGGPLPSLEEDRRSLAEARAPQPAAAAPREVPGRVSRFQILFRHAGPISFRLYATVEGSAVLGRSPQGPDGDPRPAYGVDLPLEGAGMDALEGRVLRVRQGKAYRTYLIPLPPRQAFSVHRGEGVIPAGRLEGLDGGGIPVPGWELKAGYRIHLGPHRMRYVPLESGRSVLLKDEQGRWGLWVRARELTLAGALYKPPAGPGPEDPATMEILSLSVPPFRLTVEREKGRLLFCGTESGGFVMMKAEGDPQPRGIVPWGRWVSLLTEAGGGGSGRWEAAGEMRADPF